jgi:hypothetical protein
VASVADSDPYDIILGLPDPDQKIRGTNPAPDPSMYHQAKKIRKTMIPTVLCSVADPGCLSRIRFFPSQIPDPNFFFPVSASNNLSILTQQIGF